MVENLCVCDSNWYKRTCILAYHGGGVYYIHMDILIQKHVVGFIMYVLVIYYKVDMYIGLPWRSTCQTVVVIGNTMAMLLTVLTTACVFNSLLAVPQLGCLCVLQ